MLFLCSHCTTKYEVSSIDESEHVFSGRWQFHEDTLRKHTWNTLAHLSAMSEHLITFDDDEFGDGVHELSVDCVNFTVNELRTDPSSKWFDQKSHSAGNTKYYIIVSHLLNDAALISYLLIDY